MWWIENSDGVAVIVNFLNGMLMGVGFIIFFIMGLIFFMLLGTVLWSGCCIE
jgi:hypothetical protein